MKKRILSLFVACLMVVGVFVAALPMSKVAAEESDSATEWKFTDYLPTDSTLKNGPFSVAMLRQDTGAPITDVKIKASGNDWDGFPHIQAGYYYVLSYYLGEVWLCAREYKNYQTGGGPKYDYNIDAAVIFTAPKDGEYTFDAVLNDIQTKKDQYGPTTVYLKKVGSTERLDEDSTADKTTLELTGTVSLKAGEQVQLVTTFEPKELGLCAGYPVKVKEFTVTDATANNPGTDEEPDTKELIWKMSEHKTAEDATLTNGPFSYAMLNQTTGEPITDFFYKPGKNGCWDLYPVEKAGYYYIACLWTDGYIYLSPRGYKNFQTGDGPKYDYNIDAAVIFTAPEDGEYTFDANLKVTVALETIFYLKKVGSTERLDEEITTEKNKTFELTGSVTLKKGEQVYLVAAVNPDEANGTAIPSHETLVNEFAVTAVVEADPETPPAGGGEDPENPPADTPETEWNINDYVDTFAGLTNGPFTLSGMNLTSGEPLNSTFKPATAPFWNVYGEVYEAGAATEYDLVNYDAKYGLWTRAQRKYTDADGNPIRVGWVVTFTAPRDGEYDFSFAFKKDFGQNNQGAGRDDCTETFYVVKAGETEKLASANSTYGAGGKGEEITLDGSVELKAGEQLWFVGGPSETSNCMGSYGGYLNDVNVEWTAELSAKNPSTADNSNILASVVVAVVCAGAAVAVASKKRRG